MTDSNKDSRCIVIEFSKSYLDNVLCPICMEPPHNAIHLRCASNRNGCNVFICNTSRRHSNCFNLFVGPVKAPKFYKFMRMDHDNSDSESESQLEEEQGAEEEEEEEEEEDDDDDNEEEEEAAVGEEEEEEVGGGGEGEKGGGGRGEVEGEEEEEEEEEEVGGGRGEESFVEGDIGVEEEEIYSLMEELFPRSREKVFPECPLCCRPVDFFQINHGCREYLDKKIRSCSKETCTFSGNYSELREHAWRDHPEARPGKADPARVQKWHQLELETAFNDTVTARLEAEVGAETGADAEDRPLPWWNLFQLLQEFGRPAESNNQVGGAVPEDVSSGRERDDRDIVDDADPDEPPRQRQRLD